jgi:hypothetical protein
MGGSSGTGKGLSEAFPTRSETYQVELLQNVVAVSDGRPGEADESVLDPAEDLSGHLESTVSDGPVGASGPAWPERCVEPATPWELGAADTEPWPGLAF